ncbi:hypothetical protein ACLUEY_00600 [Vreelandella aquamarina]
MQSKYKVNLLRANLLAAAVALAFLAMELTSNALLMVWLSVSWLFASALLLDFSHRRTGSLPWQLLPGALLTALLVSAPQQNSMLVWAWAALFMLPQSSWVIAINLFSALLSLVFILPTLSHPEGWLITVTLVIVSLLSLARARQLLCINGAIRQRFRLIPGLNLWAREQLIRDLPREQIRCEREGIYAELVILRLRRHQLWQTARDLCLLTYHFENVYRLNGTVVATLLLSRSQSEGSERRQRLLQAIPDKLACHVIELIDIETSELDVDALIKQKHKASPVEPL